MQERYLGDVHDFNKFLFLKFVNKIISEKIGLNWYLVETNSLGKKEKLLNDGEKRKYLSIKKNSELNKELIKEFEPLLCPGNRKVKSFTQNTHLNNSIVFYNKPLTQKKRLDWFRQSINYFKNQKIIFLDPDNGLIPKSVSTKSVNSIKYVLFSEIKELSKANKIIIFSQFQSFSQNHKLMLMEKIILLKEKINISVNCPIIRNRSAPNSFFITICPKPYQKLMFKIINNYKSFNETINLISPSFFIK